MAAGSRERLERARARLSYEELRRRLADRPAPPRLRLHESGFDLIAEIKPRSPAVGSLVEQDVSAFDMVKRTEQQAAAYARGGACAISVLTEPDRFDGSLGYLASAAGVVDVPVMRKDFLVDPYQVLEGRLFGAGGVLVIARMLGDALDEMIATALEQGMFVLLEAFDEADIEQSVRALESLDPNLRRRCLLGVNARNLRTLEIDDQRLERLFPRLPAEFTQVAESGLDEQGVARMARRGYRAALVGSVLMKHSDPEAGVAAMLRGARAIRQAEV
ncbi:hypothetical protein ABI59_14895 [Acidobacteria bacterium Mor1]|nr:hypothetical protein ABI59_14895 [Acidobacteria bacterium Mor1]